jgi:hypothetical protein
VLIMQRAELSAARLLVKSPDDLPAHYREVFEGSAKQYGTTVEAMMRDAGRELLDDIREAVRFRIERRASEMLIEMAARDDQRKRLLASGGHLFLPAPRTWFELDTSDPAQRFGALARGHGDSLQDGTVTIWMPGMKDADQYETVRIPFDLRRRPPAWINPEDRPWLGWILAKNAGYGEGMCLLPDPAAAGALLLAALAFLCTPSAWVAREVSFGPLNRQRAKHGKWPLLAYREVRLSVGGDPPTVSPGSGKGPERALHFVRSHLRVRACGRVEIVRWHWRGNAELGIKRPAYVVTG